jgi:hypothetical protein
MPFLPRNASVLSKSLTPEFTEDTEKFLILEHSKHFSVSLPLVYFPHPPAFFINNHG